jgi:hypothetical protein
MDMTALECICVYVNNKGIVSLQKINMDKPRPFGIYWGLSEIADGSLDKELISYGCDPKEVKEAIDKVMVAQLYEEIFIGKV